jgi:lipopolysaccharide export system protein LptA
MIDRKVLAAVILAFALVFPQVRLAAADPITFAAGKVKSVFASGREETVLSENARIVTGDIEISAAEIRLYGNKQRFIEGSGNIAIHDSKRNINLTGDVLFFDRDTEILKVTGNTVMEDFDNDMLVRGGMLESRNKDNITIIQVGVRVFKKDIVARSEMLVYRRDDDMVELTGLPFVTKKKDEYKASTITIDLKTEEIQLMGKVQGTVQSKSDEGTSAAPAPTAKPDAGATQDATAADQAAADQAAAQLPPPAGGGQ